MEKHRAVSGVLQRTQIMKYYYVSNNLTSLCHNYFLTQHLSSSSVSEADNIYRKALEFLSSLLFIDVSGNFSILEYSTVYMMNLFFV